MTKQVRVKFISDGFRQVLMSGGVQELVGSEADRIKNSANANNNYGGVGFKSRTWEGSYGGGRWVASVSTTDIKSMLAESEDKALTRAVKNG